MAKQLLGFSLLSNGVLHSSVKVGKYGIRHSVQSLQDSTISVESCPWQPYVVTMANDDKETQYISLCQFFPGAINQKSEIVFMKLINILHIFHTLRCHGYKACHF